MHRTAENVAALLRSVPAQADLRTQSDVFWEMFVAFAGLGTLVGVVVVSYLFYNVYKYRDGSGEGEAEEVEVGEIPTGKGKKKTKKLALSLSLSALLVIALVVYAYTALLYVEAGPDIEDEEELAVEVEGFQFGWNYEYENGIEESGTLRIPEDTVVRLDVTSSDVWHNFGITELRVKADSIPGQTAETWVSAEEGEYLIECFELCGDGHSQMIGTLDVMEEDEFYEWYEANAPEEGS